MNTKQKKALYESIMKSVAKTVKKALNENNSYDVWPCSLKNKCFCISSYFQSNKIANNVAPLPINVVTILLTI